MYMSVEGSEFWRFGVYYSNPLVSVGLGICASGVTVEGVRFRGAPKYMTPSLTHMTRKLNSTACVTKPIQDTRNLYLPPLPNPRHPLYSNTEAQRARPQQRPHSEVRKYGFISKGGWYQETEKMEPYNCHISSVRSSLRVGIPRGGAYHLL